MIQQKQIKSKEPIPQFKNTQEEAEFWDTHDVGEYLTRIIHQPEKSTGEGDYVAQMNHKTTLLQAHDAPKTISSGRPDTAYIGLMGAIERTASCQLPGAYLNGLAREPLGLSLDLTGPAR